ncbi:Protein cereblon [Chionoecetes opilio]|uniref:Protein cereblon n=1 Tax=Chionoecetes opilio TaxID=41210 RepID=A0A8J4YQA8_CHIOP|nr:Protein cereblon [Chionoecetes opilio]
MDASEPPQSISDRTEIGDAVPRSATARKRRKHSAAKGPPPSLHTTVLRVVLRCSMDDRPDRRDEDDEEEEMDDGIPVMEHLMRLEDLFPVHLAVYPGRQEEDEELYDLQDSPSEESEGDATAEMYDTTLPSRHEYLGETEELRGRTVQEENEYISLPLLQHSSLMNLVLVPTQTLPLSIFQPIMVSMLRSVILKDRTFGIVHSKASQDGQLPELAKYGTTAEIYEYQGEEVTPSMSIKAKGRQRFKVVSTHRESTGLTVAKVQILPEIQMGSPFEMMRLRSLDKLTLPSHEDATERRAHKRDLDSVRTSNCWRVRRRNAWLTSWPLWVYNQYDDLLLVQKLVNELMDNTMIKPAAVTLPRDPQELSHWAAINLPLDNSHRLFLLSLNTPTQRLKYILSVLTKCKKLTCVHCGSVIGDYADIFSMSVEGPQGTFVNPGGYVHEMLTLTKAGNLTYNPRRSTEHSWFPGYAWTIASCSSCLLHIGWKFTATTRKLKPQKFYGLTRSAVKAKLVGDEEDVEEEPLHII